MWILAGGFVVFAVGGQLADIPQAAPISGRAVIVDGDTMRVGLEEIRRHGIDAPETGQKCELPKGTWNCSQAAIDALATMTAGKSVHCEGHERDQYRRLIARCSTDEVPDIGAKLVASGLAWAFLKYSTDYTAVGPQCRCQELLRRFTKWASPSTPQEWMGCRACGEAARDTGSRAAPDRATRNSQRKNCGCRRQATNQMAAAGRSVPVART